MPAADNASAAARAVSDADDAAWRRGTAEPAKVWPGQSYAKDQGRLSETFKHPHTGTSVEYARIVELECRLLEKEWSGYPGEFGKMRLR